MIPAINIAIRNGGLGNSVQTNDGIMGMICTGVAASPILGVPRLITSLDDAIALGVTDVADAFAYKHIKEFYDEAGKGANLYIMLVAESQTMVQSVDNTLATGAKKLLDFATGNIKVLGVVRNPTTEASVPTNFFRADVMSAITGSIPLVTAYRNAQTPIRILLGGRLDVVTNVPQDLKLQTNNAVAVVAGDTSSTSNNAAVGLALGRLARIPVSTNMGRVKDGVLPILKAFIGAVGSEYFSQRSVLIDKGAITITSYAGRVGYYWSDDPTTALVTDDYTNLCYGRLIDKIQRISYQIFVDELNNSVPIDTATGRIAPEVVKSLEGKIESAVRIACAGEVSSFDAFIDVNQNIIATGILEVQESAVPFGYSRIIKIVLGLNNPF
jgi:Protein of unknown function (DUF2586)